MITQSGGAGAGGTVRGGVDEALQQLVPAAARVILLRLSRQPPPRGNAGPVAHPG